RPARMTHRSHDGGFSIRIYPTPAREAASTPEASLPASAICVEITPSSWDLPEDSACATLSPSAICDRVTYAGDMSATRSGAPDEDMPANASGFTNPSGARYSPDDCTSVSAPYDAPASAALRCVRDTTGSTSAIASDQDSTIRSESTVSHADPTAASASTCKCCMCR